MGDFACHAYCGVDSRDCLGDEDVWMKVLVVVRLRVLCGLGAGLREWAKPGSMCVLFVGGSQR